CDAIHGTARNESYFEQTGPMTEAILLGTVAIRTPDTLLKWDAEKMAITNNSAADNLLSRNYHKGWSVAGF
ncbi:MAG: gfo/Idh/MocA family oxidoreductase, partial [Verrucomicrobiota bacterium]|nr:gfo/Idh/MocA family oxidoreductase [Verrucomicrobiota bacterium]